MDVQLLTLKVSPGGEGYGINFRGSSPVIIDTVLPGSPAEKSGFKYGDFFLELNGNDVQSFTKESLISAIKSCNRGVLSVRVGRVRPIPMTTEDRKLAIKMIQNKQVDGGNRSSLEIQNYEKTVKNSLLEVEDLLGSFNLPPMTAPTSKPAATPSKSTQAKVTKSGQIVQELEVALYDSDSLPSPPSSEASSEADAQDKDKLLDFTLDDELNYNPSSAPLVCDPSLDGLEAPGIMKATLQAKHGIEGMKEIIRDVKEKKKKKATQQEVTTEATFAPSVTHGNKKPERVSDVPKISSHVSSSSRPPPLAPSTAKPISTSSPQATSPAAFFTPPSMRTSVPHTPTTPVGTAVGKTPKSTPLATNSPSSKTPPFTASSPVTAHPLPPKKQPKRGHPNTALPPEPLSVSDRQMQKKSGNMSGASDDVSKRHISQSPPIGGGYNWDAQRQRGGKESAKFKGEEWESSKVKRHGGGERGSPRVGHIHSVAQPASPLTRSPLVRETIPALSTNPPHGIGSESPSPPPPVPPYNPTHPDEFPLSNSEEYRMEFKQKTHSYEEVNKEEVRRLQRNILPNPRSTPPSSPLDSKVGVSMPSPTEIPFRRKKKNKGGDLVARRDEGGHVGDEISSGGHGKLEIGKIQAQQELDVGKMNITDLASWELACDGLPISVHDWKYEEVYQWLRQLSPTLYKLYKPNFVKHDIIGRTLLRLNMNKIKNMGVTSVKHSHILATEITRLKVRQEKVELQELQEDNQLTYL